MLPLPSSCEPCPFYQYRHHPGNGFVPDTVVPGSTVYFVAQNPGKDEVLGHRLLRRHFHGGSHYTDDYDEVTPQPLIGATGQMFTQRFLPLAGLARDQISVGNAIRCKPGLGIPGLKPDDLPPLTTTMTLETSKAAIVQALRHCRDTYLQVPSSTKVIMSMGRYAMFALTGIQKEDVEYGKKQGVLESWRGYGVDANRSALGATIETQAYHPLTGDLTIFFTMHIAALYHGDNQRFFNAALQDFRKLRLLLNGTWPQPVPTWSTTPPATWPAYAAFDTEYIVEHGNRLTRWSLCDSTHQVYCIEVDGTTTAKIPITPGSVVLLQNALADIGHLAGLVDFSAVQVEDMMLADSVLWTGEPHNLNFIASKYGSLNRWKHLAGDHPQMYSAMDAHQPMYMWRHHYIPMFKDDPLSWRIYKQHRLPLIAIIDKAQRTGAKTDTARLAEVQAILHARLASSLERARILTQNPLFALGGQKDMTAALYAAGSQPPPSQTATPRKARTAARTSPPVTTVLTE